MGAIATGHRIATSIGIDVLRHDGNAVDAAVASAFALFVLMPEACGLGGDAFALVATPTTTLAFNGSGRFPRRYARYAPEVGPGLATVPGAIAALGDLHEAFGKLPWPTLLQPAIRLAAEGISVSGTLHEALVRQGARLTIGAPEWPLIRSRDDPRSPVRQQDLADTMCEIAEVGPSTFYVGDLARRLADALDRYDSALDAEDLAQHRTIIGAPVSAHLKDAVRGNVIIEVPPPVSQAVLIPFALQALGAANVPGIPRAHLATEALEEAFQWRPQLASSPGVNVLPRDWIPSGGRARRLGGARGTSHTTSVSTVDADGCVVSLLVSVFHDFGSCFLVPGLGFFLNDRMSGLLDTSRSPDVDRPIHTLSPVILRTAESCCGLATPGADAQVQVLTQILDAAIHSGLSLSEAMSLPRWRLQDRTLVVEDNLDPDLAVELRLLGHEIVAVPSQHRSMGAVTAAGITGDGCMAIVDGRRGTSGAVATPH